MTRKEKEYPPRGTFYMYPCYDEDNNLIKFSSDYEEEGAYGSLSKLEVNNSEELIKAAHDKVIEEAVKWLRTNSVNYLDKCNNPTYMGGYFIKIEDMVNDLRKAIEEKV